MSGECDKCGEHCLDCKCMFISTIINLQIKISPSLHEKLFINFDEAEFQIIQIKRWGKTLTFPMWEFWQILDKHNDIE
jgi:hypothetical protein